MAFRLAVTPYELYLEALKSTANPDRNERRKADFRAAIYRLRELATSRELWWAQTRKRGTENADVIDQVDRVITDLRRFFPPTPILDLTNDGLTNLRDAVMMFGYELGYARPGSVRGEKEWQRVEEEIAKTVERFEFLERSVA